MGVARERAGGRTRRTIINLPRPPPPPLFPRPAGARERRPEKDLSSSPISPLSFSRPPVPKKRRGKSSGFSCVRTHPSLRGYINQERPASQSRRKEVGGRGRASKEEEGGHLESKRGRRDSAPRKAAKNGWKRDDFFSPFPSPPLRQSQFGRRRRWRRRP